MNGEREIAVSDIHSLLKNMKTKELFVEWKVLSEIGPEWIGSDHNIVFYLGGVPLSENIFHSYLKNVLIRVVGIPEVSDEEIIDGEGNLTLENNTLKIKYLWTKTIPYQDPLLGGNGEGILLEVQ